MSQPAALEKVRRWAGREAMVNIYGAVSIPGGSLFSVTPPRPDDAVTHDFTPPRRGVLIRHDDAMILTGSDGLRAALDAGAGDLEDIARLALLFLQDYGEYDENAGSPTVQGDFLVYYWRQNGMSRQLMKTRLDRNTFAVASEPVSEMN